MRVLDHFPGDAARGGDLQSGASTPRHEFEPIHSDQWGTAYRPERVLALEVWVEELTLPQGEVCFLESTVRGMGQLIGLVPVERMLELERELQRERVRVEALEGELAEMVMVEKVVKGAVEKSIAQALEEADRAVVAAAKRQPPKTTPKVARDEATPPSDEELEAAKRR